MEHADFAKLGRVGMPIPTVGPILELSGASRRFSPISAVEDLTLSLMPGQVTCLLGPSGCGKSTTLRLIAGIERLDRGQIRINGQVVADGKVHLPPEQRPVGMVFQDLALFPHMTVGANVGFGLGRDSAPRIAALLERVGMGHHAGKYPHQLSGGEQQRVALIRALATRPQVMLLDEPFSSLDQSLRIEMRELALELLGESGAAAVLVTHDPDEAMMMADRIAIMRAGRIRQVGAPLDLYRHPVDLDVARFFSALNLFSGRVVGGRVETPIGTFPAPKLDEGALVHCAFRPEHSRLAPVTDASQPRATVLRVHNLGREHVVELQMPGMTDYLRCAGPGHCSISAGSEAALGFDLDKAMIFPRHPD